MGTVRELARVLERDSGLGLFAGAHWLKRVFSLTGQRLSRPAFEGQSPRSSATDPTPSMQRERALRNEHRGTLYVPLT